MAVTDVPGMRRRLLPASVGAALVAIVLLSTSAQAAPDWAAAEAVPVVQGLRMPANIEIAPDGAVWYAEIGGNVSRLDPGDGSTETVHTVEVVTGTERGLVGMALAHDFAQEGAFYLYYTEPTDDPDGGINRLVRVAHGQERLLASVPAADQHNGGRILVAPDGTLFVGTGENLLRDPAQDPGSLLGKVLRMTPQGGPVDGNLEGLVYSLGHRNVFGLAMHPETGEVWATENSGWRRDEVNRIEAGGNYGYPECEGHGLNGVDDPCPTDKGYTFPILTFYEDRTAAPTGAAFWHGDFHWASLNEGSIHRIQKNETQAWNDTIVFQHDGAILDLDVGPEGDLHFATFDGIWRLDFGGPGGATEDQGAEISEGTPAPSALAAVVLAGILAARRIR